MLPRAREVWLEANEKFFGNASSPHRIGARADRALSEAREKLGAFLGCNPEDIVWTSGATESNNAVFHHFVSSARAGAEIWTSSIEHPSVLAPARKNFAERHCFIPTTHEGVIDLEWIKRQLPHERPQLIALMAVNNETGVLQPWREVLELCRESDIRFVCDAVQWIGKLPAKGLGDCDFVSGSAHKFGGPKGVGFLKCSSRHPLRAMICGGPQEEGRRAGTENVPGVLSMIAALENREAALMNGEKKAKMEGRERFEQKMLKLLPGSEIVGEGSQRLWNTVSALMPETDCQQRWVVKLDKLGFAVSTGSACSSGQEKPSHVLTAMGYDSAESSRVLRFSSGWETTESDWEALIEALVRAYQEISQREAASPEILAHQNQFARSGPSG